MPVSVLPPSHNVPRVLTTPAPSRPFLALPPARREAGSPPLARVGAGRVVAASVAARPPPGRDRAPCVIAWGARSNASREYAGSPRLPPPNRTCTFGRIRLSRGRHSSPGLPPVRYSLPFHLRRPGLHRGSG